MPLRIALLLTVAAALALPSAAHAAIAGSSQVEGDDIVFAADPGEANRLTVTGLGGERVTFEDAGAPVTAGRRCTQETPNRVTCEGFGFVIVSLEDGDDEATTAGQFGSPEREKYVYLDGQQGNDTLRGEVGRTSLDGGVGSDRLIGGPQTSGIDAVDVVGGPSGFAGMPDHNRERDEVTCAQSTEDAAFVFVQVDTTDVTSGPCPPLRVYSEDFVLIEGTEAGDTLLSAGPPSRVFGLGGNDFLSGQEDDRLDGGEGDDRVTGYGLALGGPGNDRVDAGARTFAPRPRLDGQAGDDQVLGSAAGDSLAGGTGADSISGREGNDSIRARDGVRDKVRCGPGRDRVSADRRDSVASDCEVVSRG